MYPHLAIYFVSPFGRYTLFHTLTSIGPKSYGFNILKEIANDFSSTVQSHVRLVRSRVLLREDTRYGLSFSRARAASPLSCCIYLRIVVTRYPPKPEWRRIKCQLKACFESSTFLATNVHTSQNFALHRSRVTYGLLVDSGQSVKGQLEITKSKHILWFHFMHGLKLSGFYFEVLLHPFLCREKYN